MASRAGGSNICMMAPTFYPAIGGAEFLAAELAKGLADTGFHVIFVAPENSAPPKSWRQTPAIEFYPILSTGRFRDWTRTIFRVWKALAGKPLMLVHAHFALPTGLFAIPLAVFRRLPLVITSPGSDIQVSERISYGARRWIAHSIATRIILRLSSAHVVLCRSMIQDALAAGSTPAKIEVVYPGVHDPPTKIVPSPILQDLGITAGDFVVLFLGRLIPKKAPDDVVKAAAKIVEAVANAKVIIAGYGAELERLRSATRGLSLAERVKFAGIVVENDKDALLDRCDVFVIPSIIEGMPHLLLEAMAFGKPIVATDIPPFREVLATRDLTILVPIRSPSAIAEAVIRIATSLRQKRHEWRLERVNRFGADRMVDGYIQVYKEVLNTHHGD